MIENTMQIEIEEVNVNGQSYCLSLEVECETEDEGIGSYEYWGATGSHSLIVKNEVGREVIEAFRIDEDEELLEISGAEILQVLHSEEVSKRIERELEKEEV